MGLIPHIYKTATRYSQLRGKMASSKPLLVLGILLAIIQCGLTKDESLHDISVKSLPAQEDSKVEIKLEPSKDKFKETSKIEVKDEPSEDKLKETSKVEVKVESSEDKLKETSKVEVKDAPSEDNLKEPNAAIELSMKENDGKELPSNPPTKRQAGWNPFFPFFNPGFYFNNPFFNQITTASFNSLVDQYKNDLEMMRHRQNLMLKYTECLSPDSNNCKRVTGNDVGEDLRNINYWNWAYNRPDVEYITSERFYAVMHSFKNAIEKLTLRQNVLYEYVQCSCTNKSECGASIKPVLDVMFANNPNITGELIQNLFVPGADNYNPASNFFQALASFFSQIPSWFTYNFNPTSTLLSSTASAKPNYSYGTSASNYQPGTSSPSTSTSTGSYPSGSYPTSSSASSYSSSSGNGQQVTGGYISTSFGDKPSQEQYVVNTNGGNVQLSSSSDGPGSSVSASSSSGRGVRVNEPAFLVNPGIAASQIGVNAAQAGIQAGAYGAQAGLSAAQHGIHTGYSAAQHGIHAGLAASGLYGTHVPY